MFFILKWLMRLLFFIPRFDIARTAEGAYNTRYTLVPRWLAALFGKDGVFLHHFQQSDPTEDFHNHPYGESWSCILAGGYREERFIGWRWRGWKNAFHDAAVHVRTRRVGDVNRIYAGTYHRIDLLDVRGCWTLFVAGKKTQEWGFRNRRTGQFRPWSGKKPTEFYQ